MRYHFPAFFVCEGTAEDKPCTHGPEGSGMVAVGLLRVSDCGPKLGQATKTEPPPGWEKLKVEPPAIRSRREQVSPMASPWAMAAASGEFQMALTCPKCSEHLKVEDMVKDAAVASEKGQLQ